LTQRHPIGLPLPPDVVLKRDGSSGKLRFDFVFGEGSNLLVIVMDVNLHGGLRCPDSQLGDKKSMDKASGKVVAVDYPDMKFSYVSKSLCPF
jgi:hypothetical protein